MATRKNIALVLSGGAARGLAHIGVIEELIAQGFNIKSITGTSMGAMVGAFHAMGKLEEFKNWVLKLNRYSVIRLMDFSFRGGFLKGEKVLDALQSVIPGKNIEDFDIPFCCLATDILTQSIVTFETGDIYEALRASYAIPSVFTPVAKNGMLLVDGGVLNNIPVDYAIKTKRRDVVLAVNVNARTAYKGMPSQKFRKNWNVWRLSNEVISTMTEKIADLNLTQNPPDFMINISRFSCELYEFYKAKKQIEFGRKCAREQLKNYTF